MTDDPVGGSADDRGAVSAQVVLWPADRTVDVDEPITSETLARHLPDTAEAEAVRRWFAERGFKLGPLVGIGFSITAPPDVFAATFGAAADVPLRAAQQGQREGLAFSLGELPEEDARPVRAVELTPPPDFGPTAP